jgi:cell wall-associated NlpC family hydrolase
MPSSIRVLSGAIALLATASTCLCLGVAVWVGGTGGPGLLGVVAPVIAPSGTGGLPETPGGPSPAAQRAVSWALAERGTPYRWGGEGPGGFDCSGLVQAAFGAAGVRLPRVAQDQYDAGPRLAPGTPLKPGDLVFFGGSAVMVDHVGMVVSTGEMVDAPHTGAVVRIEPIFSTGYVGATRPAP